MRRLEIRPAGISSCQVAEGDAKDVDIAVEAAQKAFDESTLHF